jgi:hypothetical protein
VRLVGVKQILIAAFEMDFPIFQQYEVNVYQAEAIAAA